MVADSAVNSQFSGGLEQVADGVVGAAGWCLFYFVDDFFAGGVKVFQRDDAVLGAVVGVGLFREVGGEDVGNVFAGDGFGEVPA